MFSHSSVVRFSDTDAMGHVNHARFLSYCEEARVAFFAARMPQIARRGLIVARAEVDYLAPIFVGRGTVDVHLSVHTVGRSSFRLGNAMAQGDRDVGRATVVMVAYDYTAGRARPFDEAERDTLAALQD